MLRSMLRHLQVILAIVFAAFPIFGVIFYGWDAREVIFLYWVENLIIGFWTIARMLTTSTAPIGGRLFTSGFFTVHYGMFCFVHGVFLLAMTSWGKFSGPVQPTPEVVLEIFSTGGLVALAVNFLMQGVAMVREQFVQGEHRTVSLPQQMQRPYKHIVVVHLAIIATGFVVIFLPKSTLLLALLAAGKLVLDLRRIRGEKAEV